MSEKRKQIKSPDHSEPEMVYVDGGKFQMGSNYNNEKPVHEVTVNDFYISKYPITVAQYRLFCDETRSRKMPEMPKEFGGWLDDHPIINVTWEDAKEYCKWKNGRLPTEAEWEFVAKGGNKSKNYEYSGSDQVNDVADIASSKTYPVGSKAPNELNLFDMSGNVWEWCMDWHDHYRGESQNNPQGPTEGNERVQRGGSWRGPTENQLQVTIRRGDNPKNICDNVGFRLVKDIQLPEQKPLKPPIIAQQEQQLESVTLQVSKLETIVVGIQLPDDELTPMEEITGLKTLIQSLIQHISDLEKQIKEIENQLPGANGEVSRQLSEMRLNELKQLGTLCNQKRFLLGKQSILENRVDEKLRLKSLIEETNSECHQIEQEIRELETQLS